RTIDFLLSEKRDTAAAKRFFIKAIQNNEAPAKITLDGYEASHRAVAELKAVGMLPLGVEVRTSKYLNKHDRARLSASETEILPDAWL
ncbi:MAG: DDE-type integrase/transposase/recombinase, partial [Pyrinomonadaceae bacterium]|nr:DDE-type integrase/transposase/recombinase [Pyrinomonadaceae bacterium]